MPFKDPERRRQYAREWYLKNRAITIERARAWRLTDPERYKKWAKQYYAQDTVKKRVRLQRQQNPKIRIGKKRYYQKNRARISVHSKQYYAANADAICDRVSRYRVSNTEKCKEAVRVWTRKYPHKVKAVAAARRDLRGSASAEQIAARVAFFGGVCAYCGGPFQHLDHAIAVVRGGTGWPANLRPACQRCNQRKKARDWRQWPIRLQGEIRS